MRKDKLRERAEREYGKVPEFTYFPGDLSSIRSLYEYQRRTADDTFYIDDVTWDDLDMDRVFQRINLGMSSAGEQCLYSLLRKPAMDRAEFDRRNRLVEAMEARPERRSKLQCLLMRLGRSARIDLFQLFDGAGAGAGRLPLYVCLSAAMVLSLLVALLSPFKPLLFLFVALLGINPVVHHRMEAENGWRLSTVQYCAAVVDTARRMCKRPDGLEEYAAQMSQPLSRLKQFKGVPVPLGLDELAGLVNSLLLLDLIAFERQKDILLAHETDFMALFEQLGTLDAAVCAASFRRSVAVSTVPVMEFETDRRHLSVQGLVHPLVRGCVPNDLEAETSLLITGSNASGKTTFLRAAAINLILAQGICTVLAEDFHASCFRVLTSIDIADSVTAGESYYVSELNSLRRVVEAAGEPGAPVFCCLDEILRGTNAVERIAASTEILAYLGERCLCMAATHDIELCALLDYSLWHFEEQITEGEMTFDYRLKPGGSQTSNAIRLLELMEFPAEIVAKARALAGTYLREQAWKKPE